MSRISLLPLFHALRLWAVAVFFLLLPGLTQGAGRRFPVPPEPPVRPIIEKTYGSDADGDGIDDELLKRNRVAEAALNQAANAAAKGLAAQDLAQMVEVELVFDEQITQAQMDDFVKLGGEITYVYRAVSYGWNGRLPLGKVSALHASMAKPPRLLHESRPVKLHLDKATRVGRARPVWAAGFANSALGFSGNTNITIAIVDTGVDDTHADLQARRVYWRDFSSDASANAVDLIKHGTHVAGIATGTGAASGANTGPMAFSLAESLSGVASGSFYPAPFDLPAGPVNCTITATWNGGGSTTLYLVNRPAAGGTWSAQYIASGTSPLSINTSFTPSASLVYSAALVQNDTLTVAEYVINGEITGYGGVGDGFNKFRGVAPGCRWAGAKVFSNDGTSTSTSITAAIDDLVLNRTNLNIKVMNLSLGVNGSPGLNATERQKVNTAVNNGILVVVSAGNDGESATATARTIDDPGRAGMALTVAASDDNNQLTEYSSQGFASPKTSEDYKPDLMGPGGSQNYYSSIWSADSNSVDTNSAAPPNDVPDDYTAMQGTSMASPFVAGCAALVVDALQQKGTNWDFASSQHARLVKMLLCATASESNATRNDGGSRSDGSVNPTLQRATAGPSSFPIGKDMYEGYGMVNPDAAVEAVSLAYAPGNPESATLGPSASDRRVWARAVAFTNGQAFKAYLATPAGGDFDLYLYSSNPTATGTPRLLASSTAAGNGLPEYINYTPTNSAQAYLVVKRIAGSGDFTLDSPRPPGIGTPPQSQTNQLGGPAALTVAASGSPPLKYQWQKSPDASQWSVVNGATNAALAFNPLVLTNGGFYRCVVTNLFGTNTSTSASLTVNQPPAPAALVMTRYPWGGAKLPLASFTGTDPEGDLVTLAGITNQSAHQGVVAQNGGEVFYTPALGYTNADSFNFTLRDSRGGSATGTVTVNVKPPAASLEVQSTELGNGFIQLKFFGIPNRTYTVEYATSLPANDWQTLGVATADAAGGCRFQDTSANAAQRVYRAVSP